MSNSKTEISYKNQKAIREIAAGDARVITPDNPLIIDYAPASFDNLDIQGGSIYTQTRTQVTIFKLTKTS